MSKPSLMYCGSCSYFLFEADGYGICNITNSERRCSDTCRKYAENPMITSETGSKAKINQKTSAAMTLNEYQQEALTTANYPDEFKTIYPAIGLNGEAGEVAEKVKRIIRDTDYKKDGSGAIVVPEIKALNIAVEIGDVLWYCATLAHDIGFTLDDVALINVNKLRDRARRGLISGEGDFR